MASCPSELRLLASVRRARGSGLLCRFAGLGRLARDRSRRCSKNDPRFARDDLRDVIDRDQQEPPAEQPRAHSKRVGPVDARVEAHVLDEADPPVRRLDAEALTASEPILAIEARTSRVRFS